MNEKHGCFMVCGSNSQTATTETRTDLRSAKCVTWSSPLLWWPSRTTRAKFTPRTWDWSPSVHKRRVCTTSLFLASFFPVSPQKIRILNIFLLFLGSSNLSNTSSRSAQEETSRGFQRHSGRWRRRRRWWRQRLQPFLLHVPGVVQQSAHGPAALRRQEAQKTDDKDEADGDVRPGHGARSAHTAATHRSPSHNSASWFSPVVWAASTLKGYPCTICKIELNSVEQYQSHISGAKHNNQ